MFKSLAIFSLLFSSVAFAQDMSKTETYESAYRDQADGSTKYVGRCSTHEDYEKVFFKKQKVFQNYVEIDSLSDLQLKNLIARFDKDVLNQVLKNLDIFEVGKNESIPSIFRNYVDDFYGETITHVTYPGAVLTRVGFGVGGGNGGYMVFGKIGAGQKLLSYTFDSEVYFCDKKVWINR